MKTLRTLLALAFIIAFGFAQAQSYAFKVLANKGTNQVKSGGEWGPLKTGASLKSTDEIKVSDNAYIGLLHSGGKTIEVKNAGTYKIADLESKVPQGSSPAGKYADYLAQQSADGAKNKLSATGAVHRGAGSESINVYMPASGPAQVYGESIIIRWDALEGSDVTYKVKLQNMFEDILISEETKNTWYELDLTDSKIEGNNIVLLTVSTAEGEEMTSKQFAIQKLQENEKKQVKTGLSELVTDVQDQSALNKYILAGFYEENNLLVDALTAYEEAIKLAPDVETFREAYNSFLLRNGLK